MSALVGVLECKAVKHGRTFAKVDRAFPPRSLLALRILGQPKPLHVGERTCGQCATVHDRDHNAARNILLEGRRTVAPGTGGDAKRLVERRYDQDESLCTAR